MLIRINCQDNAKIVARISAKIKGESSAIMGYLGVTLNAVNPKIAKEN